MSVVPSHGRALPNPRTTRMLGIFNIIFASALMLCGLCSGVYVAMMPTILKAMSKVQVDIKLQVENQRKAEIKSLDEEAAAATTEKEKTEIAERRKKVDERPAMPTTPMMDISAMGMDDPKLQAWTWIEVFTGLLVNLMMLASGIGLLNCKTWSWKLGLWTAILKIARLSALYMMFVIAIVPPFASKMGFAVTKMMTEQQAMAGRPVAGLPSPDLLIKAYSIMYSVMGLGMILVGSIYPCVLIWCLTRKSVRACFPQAAAKPPTEFREL